MKTKHTKRKIAKTAVGAGIGAAIAGPIGAVAGGLAAGHVEEGLDYVGKLKPPDAFNPLPTNDPLIHVWPIVVRDEPRPTAARYALESPAEVGSFLNQLMARRITIDV